VAEVALDAELSVLALPAVLALAAVVVDLARLSQLAVLALPEVVADVAVEAVSVEALHHHRSLSAVMAGNLTSTGTPRYSPVPRSGRKAKRRP
jgi:hypothetical protein